LTLAVAGLVSDAPLHLGREAIELKSELPKGGLQLDEVGAKHFDVLLAGSAGDFSDVGAAGRQNERDEEPARAPRRDHHEAQRGLTRK
jgi:hypothetical protein